MKYQVTGNEYVSLPTIREDNGAIESISCLFMNLKGMIELKGRNGLIRPFLQCNSKEIILSPSWSREHYWIPAFSSKAAGLAFNCTYLSPIAERGFVVRLEIRNQSDSACKIKMGVNGSWDETLHTVNESILITEGKTVKRSGWNDLFVFQQVPGVPLIAFSPVVSDNQPFSHIDQDVQWEQEGFSFRLFKTAQLQSNESMKLDLFFGVGYEEVGASASAKEMLRQGFDSLHERTVSCTCLQN